MSHLLSTTSTHCRQGICRLADVTWQVDTYDADYDEPDVWYSDAALQYLVQLTLVQQLRMSRLLWLQLHGQLLKSPHTEMQLIIDQQPMPSNKVWVRQLVS